MLRSLLRARRVAALALLATSAAACGGFDIGAGDVAVFRVGYAQLEQSDGCFPDGEPPPDDGDSTDLRSGQTVLIYASASGDADPVYYLDTGSLVLQGVAGDEGTYTFEGLDKDVQSMGGTYIVDADHDGQDDNSTDTSVDADGDGEDDRNTDPEVDADGDFMDDRFEDDFVDTNGDGRHDYEGFEQPSDTKLVTSTAYAVSVTVTEEGITGTYQTTASVKCDGPGCATFEGQECKQSTDFVGVWVEDANVDVALGGGNPPGGS